MKLKTAIEETKEYLDLNFENDGDDFTEDDAIERLMDECGLMHDGSCSMAGSEYCDWECPFSE